MAKKRIAMPSGNRIPESQVLASIKRGEGKRRKKVGAAKRKQTMRAKRSNAAKVRAIGTAARNQRLGEQRARRAKGRTVTINGVQVHNVPYGARTAVGPNFGPAAIGPGADSS